MIGYTFQWTLKAHKIAAHPRRRLLSMTNDPRTMTMRRDSEDPRVLIFRIIGLRVHIRCTIVGDALIGFCIRSGATMKEETKEKTTFPKKAPKGSLSSQIGDMTAARRGVYRYVARAYGLAGMYVSIRRANEMSPRLTRRSCPRTKC